MLDGVLTPTIMPSDSRFLETFSFCKVLTLNSCTLRSLENFPVMPMIERLELCDNKLSCGLEVIFKHAPKLRLLKLANNFFSSVKHFDCLKDSTTLELLNIHGNPLGKYTILQAPLWSRVPSS